MKKRLIVVFAICVLYLSACGSLPQTSTHASGSAPQTPTPLSTATTRTVCHVLQERYILLNQQYQAATVQLASAHGNPQQEGEAEKTLMRLLDSIAQVQAQQKGC